MAAYLGPPAPLSTLLFDAPHALERQAYQPREMLSGTVNVDGTGVAWWDEPDQEPLLYVSDKPPWSDANIGRLAPRLRGRCQVAAVRSATPGLPSGAGAVAPFVAEGFAFAHNGYVERFREQLAAPLLEDVGARALGRIDVLTDSAAIFARLLDLHLREPGLALEDLVERAIRSVGEICGMHGVRAQLNLLVARGDTIVALRHAVGFSPNSLHLIERSSRWPAARLFASEPLDEDTRWKTLPAETITALDESGARTRHLVTATSGP